VVSGNLMIFVWLFTFQVQHFLLISKARLAVSFPQPHSSAFAVKYILDSADSGWTIWGEGEGEGEGERPVNSARR
jgi:hypothetical protein